MKATRVLIVLLLWTQNGLLAQIYRDAPKRLPDDLRTEMILFLKFDSVKMPVERPGSMSRTYYNRWKEHNSRVPEYNAQLRTHAAKYPFKYKIVSMTDTANYRNHDAKYVFWFNPFETFTTGVNSTTYYTIKVNYGAGNMPASYAHKVELGIIDLTSRKTYLIDPAVHHNLVYRYEKLLPKLLKTINKQFNENSK